MPGATNSLAFSRSRRVKGSELENAILPGHGGKSGFPFGHGALDRARSWVMPCIAAHNMGTGHPVMERTKESS